MRKSGSKSTDYSSAIIGFILIFAFLSVFSLFDFSVSSSSGSTSRDPEENISGMYTVKFKVNGEVYDSESVIIGDAINAPENKPFILGKYFEGWYTSSTNGTKVSFPYTPSDNVTLYGVFTVLSESTENLITFNLASEKLQCESGFTWSDLVNSDFNTEFCDIRENYISIGGAPQGYYIFHNSERVEKDDLIIENGNYTFERYNIESETFTVNFMVNDEVYETKTITGGSSINAPENKPFILGKNFEGWYTSSTNGTKVSFPYTPSDNVTLYGVFTILSESTENLITFNLASEKHQCENGSTWSDLVNSDFNTEFCEIRENYISIGGAPQNYYVLYNSERVEKDDLIIENGNYTFGYVSPEDNSGSDSGSDDSATLITFTIDGITYQAEEGMTWEEWVASEYNTNQKYKFNGGWPDLVFSSNAYYVYNTITNAYASKGDGGGSPSGSPIEFTIVANGVYATKYLGQGGGGN